MLSKDSVSRAYDGSNGLFQLLRAFGWGAFLNLGYFSWLRPWSWLKLNSAQRRLAQKAINCLELDFGQIVLDVGCGRGTSSYQVRALNPQVTEVIGLDLLAENVQSAKAYYSGILGLRYVQGDAHCLPFRDKQFQRILCIEAAFHFDRQKFLSEAWRVLASKGRLVIVDFMWANDNPRPLACRVSLNRVRKIWQFSDFSSIDEYHLLAVKCGYQIVAERDWTRHVIKPILLLFAVVARLGNARWGRAILSAINPMCKGLSPGHWVQVWCAYVAHRGVHKYLRYRVLVLEKP